jgi:hypothetical protein
MAEPCPCGEGELGHFGPCAKLGFPIDDPRCYNRIPRSTKESLTAYVLFARPVGGFLYAVLTNNLRESVNNGDLENLRGLPALVAYLFNMVPMSCWGSNEKVSAWKGTHHV